MQRGQRRERWEWKGGGGDGRRAGGGGGGGVMCWAVRE